MITAAIEAGHAPQSEEPTHFRTHEMTLLSTLHTNCILGWSIPWSLSAIESVMSTLIAHSTNNSTRKTSAVRTIAALMARDTAIEADTLHRACPHLMAYLST
mmetsp:Transcript_13130/g.20262  ORF Transcript_13130/g.20262 Transcript_13130/m.20262 type:complete len:102 (-) Transcript_13130:525-830(-)